MSNEFSDVCSSDWKHLRKTTSLINILLKRRKLPIQFKHETIEKKCNNRIIDNFCEFDILTEDIKTAEFGNCSVFRTDFLSRIVGLH